MGLLNRVRASVATTGTGSITPGSATSNFYLSMAQAGAVDGATYAYLLEEGSDFEIGYGVYTASGPTLTRNVTMSRISGTVGTTKMTLAGAAVLSITARMEDIVTKTGPDILRNRAVNGCMQISQENGNSAGTTTGYHGADEWPVVFSTTGAVSIQRVQSVTPAGARDRLRVSVTSADSSLSGSEYLAIQHKLEGTRVADFMFGTASAKSAILRIGMKAPAGTYSIALRNWNGGAPNRAWLGSVTISAGEANTDVVKEVVIPGDTTGTWVTDTGCAWLLNIVLASGFTAGSAGWSASSAFNLSSQSNGLSSNSNVFEFFDIGLKMDVDSIGQYGAFEVPDYARTLWECQRYFRREYDPPLAGLAGGTTDAFRMGMPLSPYMRVAPTATKSGSAFIFDGSAFANLSTISNTASLPSAVQLDFTTTGASLTPYRPVLLLVLGGGLYIDLNARM